MIDFVEYVVSQLKSKKLARADALALIRQYARPRGAGAAKLHPLLHRNVSDLERLAFASDFDGSEFFLRDHRVRGQRVLPGVAYLELARAALERATPQAPREWELRHLVWAQPLTVDAPTTAVLALYPDDDGANAAGEGIDFELYSQDERVHFQGHAAPLADAAPAPLDLAALRARMTAAPLPAERLYAAIAAHGIELGASLRGVAEVLCGDGELLARIELPEASEREGFVLHPAALDSAVQAGMALIAQRGDGRPALPFALDALRRYRDAGERLYAWVRHAAGSGADARVSKLDIDLCDEAGDVCVRLLGLSARELISGVDSEALAEDEETCLLARPHWREQALPAGNGEAFAARHVVVCDLPDFEQDPGDGANWQALRTDGGPAERYTALTLACLERLRSILSDKRSGRALLQCVVAGEGEGALNAGLAGLLRTAAQENPALTVQLIQVGAGLDAVALAARLRAEADSGAADAQVRYLGGRRETLRWQALDDAPDAAPLAFKEHGVYLITGGLGGLGRLFADEILVATTHAQVVLSGRGPLAGERAERFAALRERHGERLHYCALDLADSTEVSTQLQALRERFGRLDGIVHSAGAIADDYLLKKTAEQAAAVLAPKVAGTVHLDAASAGFDLDFFVLFSSAVSAFGNAGQGDYATANGFLDAFAAHRNALAGQGLRRGRCVSLLWPLWRDGGMAPDAATQARLQREVGMRAMSREHGVRAFHRALALDAAQALAVQGDAAKLRARLFGEGTARVVAAAAPAAATPVAGELNERCIEFLRAQFAQVLKLAAHRLDPQAPLERYGIDSILAMDLTGQLERSFGSLPKTLFFEYQSIAELAGYFVRDHAPRLGALLAPASAAATPAPAPVPASQPLPAAAPLASLRPARRRARAAASAADAPPSREPIAIVGLSGRYPEAIDVAAYWRNLRDGRDCIVEVPASRWDWRDYYSQDRSAEGRHYSKWGGFIEGVDEFDPLFFNIPPVDAELIDPQERLFLQHAWMAVEDAGYTRAALQAGDGGPAGQVGVYVGVMYGEYQLFGAENSLRGKRMGIPLSYASVANRVSYVLNLHGPSMTLDTMCSSSLTAIHLACQDLRLGRTHAAIAGGVNVSIHPNKYLILSAGQFISGDGHCQSFGEGGDGYIPGEGVGAVVLKRLSDARRDGNHIYGLIRGSALNHGGKTNGYSVPSPKAQAAAIAAALAESGMDARRIGYIEAHGTGTKLGDPIEIAALTQVFRQHTQERGFCAIGSAKSNIGHCESAAGIAGLTKVLLQLRHKQIAPSLHSAKLNPHIDFAATPFVVNQSLREWDAPVLDGREHPRLAGVSSFGAGGANAHLIVEEYRDDAAIEPATSGAALIPLSARTAAQLRRKAAELGEFLAGDGADHDLRAVAHTLQSGREAMPHRLAVLAESLPQLAQALRAYGASEAVEAVCFEGHADGGPDGLARLGQDEDMAATIARWIARGKLAKLAELWVKGLEPDWRALHGAQRPALLSLPAYPFARERYWVERVSGHVAGAGTGAVLHPLLHANVSDLYAQRYRSQFDGHEFFLDHHRVDAGAGERKWLPAAACLEMARAAAELALPAQTPSSGLELRDIAWIRPLAVTAPVTVELELQACDEHSLQFELRSGEDAEAAPHCQGFIALGAPVASAPLDLAALRTRMQREPRSAEQVYAGFAALGLHYGAGFRCIESLLRGDGEALAELRLPAAADPAYGLHPGLLDSALQAAVGTIGDDAGATAALVPFALESATLYAPCSARMFAWARRVDGAGAGLARFDIDLCDELGQVCVALRGLVSRQARAQAEAGEGTLLALPQWQPLDATVADAEPAARHAVMLLDLSRLGADALRSQLPGAEIESLDWREHNDPAERYAAAAQAVFARLQALLSAASTRPLLLQCVIADGDASLLEGLAGLLASARQEKPLLRAQLIASDASDAANLAAHLRTAAAHTAQTRLRFAAGAGAALHWLPQALPDTAAPAFKAGGVYLISGGLGGLGRAFAQAILAAHADTRVVLTGRAAADAAREAELAQLCAQWSVAPKRLEYLQLDPADRASAEAAVAETLRRHGALHGVLHSAGTTRDAYLVRKSADDFAQVLTPKVAGCCALDAATAALPLDFFVLFSSLSAALGNPGQGDYAAGNGFMDRFARERHARAARGERHGLSLSLGWPLWRDGGMRIEDEALRRLRAASGLAPLPTEAGLRAFHHALALGAAHVLVLHGDTARLAQALQPAVSPARAESAANAPNERAVAPQLQTSHAQAPQLLEPLHRYLRGELAALLKLPLAEVEVKAALERYGIDSVQSLKLIDRLERRFGALSKTLLFEHQSLASVADYLLAAFPQAVAEQLAAPVQPTPATATTIATTTVAASPRSRMRLAAPSARANAVEPVAIVGLAGRYPQADDLHAFWDNLRQGRDCIGEILADRWDHARYFDPARNRPGKTYSKWGGFLDAIDRFDPLFFNISPKEAELMDPQERLFLETAWQALEDAGYRREAVAGRKVGVYVGAMWGQYELYGVGGGEQGVPSSSFASIANRVSYFFDFHGPSLALDTMCSSSLTAIQLAAEDVRKSAVEMAIAGGVNLCTHPNKYLSLAQGNFAASDGRCRSFGAGGDGYVPGEGVGAVVLKPLSRALADGDRILALIRGGALNHGGKTNGYTVPNPLAQGELIGEALAAAGVPAHSIGYVEAHGTGTSLGDPIEIAGLSKGFGLAAGADAQRTPCAIGSVKSNIGHLESAAGIAALSKVLLQLQHAQLAPSLHAQPANPHIDFAASAFRVQTELGEWPRPTAHPRRAGISSFGAGGANAHLIVEEYDDARPVNDATGPQLFLLSARDRTALREYGARMLEHLRREPAQTLADIAYTSQLGRTPLAERLALIVDDRTMLAERLAQWLGQDGDTDGVFQGNPRQAQAAAALIEGEAGAAYLEMTLQRRDLDKLARLWIAGVEIDWARLHAPGAGRRVSLPTYPFQRERYWVRTASLPAAAIDASGHALAQSPMQTPAEPAHALSLRLQWRDSELPVSAETPRGPLLLLDSDPALGAALVRRLGSNQVVRVAAGAAFAQPDADLFAADLADEAQARQLLQILSEQGRRPQAVVRADAIDTAQPAQALLALHGLLKTLLGDGDSRALRVLALQRQDEHTATALNAGFAGYLRTLALENPKIQGKTLALAPGAETDAVAACVLAELAQPAGGEREVRYLTRDERSVRQVRDAAVFAPPAGDGAIKQQGVYLITGGLGGLGYRFAEHLALRYHARLVLSGRSPADPAQGARLQRLRELGGDAVYVQADVADAVQAQALAEAARARHGRIDGLIHAAGSHRDGYALHKRGVEIEAVLAAKVAGALNLDAALAGDALDLFVLFSSVAGALGNPGQCDYAYANAFLDAFAEARAERVRAGERSGRSLSLAWPYWAEGGMRLDADQIERARRASGLEPLPDAQGLALAEALFGAEGAVLPLYGAPGRVAAFVRAQFGAAGEGALAQTDDEAVDDAHESGDALAVAALDYLKALLGEQIRLPPERIDAEERFEAYGVDSVMIGHLNAALERDLGALPKTLFYEHASIAAVAAYLLREAAPALRRHLRPQAPLESPAPLRHVAATPAVVASASAAPLAADEPIAIIGLHGRFPQSPDLDAYWRHLAAGDDLVGPVPAQRWDMAALYDADPEQAAAGKIYCDQGGFLDDHDKFDAAFFGIPAEDARLIDPQERLFLQSAWAAVEDAGYTRERLKRRHGKAGGSDVGVFAGVTTNSYHLLTPEEWSRGNMVAPGAMPWSIANRVSYMFDFVGPSLPVDTACSSSLAAIHLACESLRRGECQLAVAGGVNLYLHPAKYQSLCRKRMLARHGRCRSFGAGDDGFVPGEGVGAVLLKPLSRAIADGDHIHAVVAASACEHSGRSNGYSAPNPAAQARLIAQALQRAGAAPASIGYVEGHGTGTQLGDNLEVLSLSQAFGSETARQSCALGSVKGNAGHAESAAGIGGVAKVVLQLRHRQLAPSLHADQPNPDIDFAATPFRLQRELAPWPAADGAPRRALVNSFGAGGVNACVVLEEYVAPATVAATAAPQLIVLSARDGERLGENAQALAAHLREREHIDLAPIAYTLQSGREPMEQRAAMIVADRAQALELLDALAAGAEASGLLRARVEPHQRQRSLKPEQREQHRALFASGDLTALAQRWLGGEEPDWDALHGERRPQRVPLPSYRFARERHWVSDAAVGQRPIAALAVAAESAATQTALHPLLTRNVSTLRETGFLSHLSGEAFYGRDHRVNGEPFFPGAGFVELACIAGTLAGERSVARIEDIVWAQPLKLRAVPQPVKTVLRASGHGTDCAVVSFDPHGERVLHCEARLFHETGPAHARPRPAPLPVDELVAAARTVDGAQCYERLRRYGFDYGPSFRGVRTLHQGAGYALARIGLDPSLRAQFDQYLLHPCLIDAALQTVLGVAGEGGDDVPYLPFALDSIQRWRPLLPECYAYAEPSRGAPAGGDVRRFDLRLLSLGGEVLVELNGFYVRALRTAATAAGAAAAATEAVDA
ncbi:SDR family NAD(P)-dependent oxidoreductase [Lysobacter enzymogenes]|uniref:SDR family NAD(P)-dependent oxidoreductase n=1 Tax=Lysobacter enzymogenes TaxID=69 RepID=UPI000895E43A|nr:SDR family NAD(P)-dependent oxidoreductase [Lysobacter enzymogenes]SDX41012.1 polyketide synthase PksN [Lysobacter enzymogenes]